MSTAYGISPDDVLTVLDHRFHFKGEAASYTRVVELFDVLDGDEIESAALYGDDMDEQTDYAHDEIAKQLLAHFTAKTVESILATHHGLVVAPLNTSFEDHVDNLSNEIDMAPIRPLLENAAQVPFLPALSVEIERQLVTLGALRPIAA